MAVVPKITLAYMKGLVSRQVHAHGRVLRTVITPTSIIVTMNNNVRYRITVTQLTPGKGDKP